MLYIRVIQTASLSRAVQIVYYHNRKRIIFKHIGSGKTDDEIESLRTIAQEIIDAYQPKLSLYGETKIDNLLHLDKSEFLGIYYTYYYDLILGLMRKTGISKIKNNFLLDLEIIRILEASSKLRSIELLELYFGIKHRRQNYYESAPKWVTLKSKIEGIVLDYAKFEYSFEYDILFYDVTTLYFETFGEDELRKNGFSKDNKPQQPQILVGLMVTKEGFRINYEVFTGNTFEGHTMLPVVKRFIHKNKVKEFTIVADAAMISRENITQLNKNNIHYIVGARLGNLPWELIKRIDKNITRADNANIRLKTNNGYLICSYSTARYKKDEYEMKKQIEKAKKLVQNPSKAKKLKFTKSIGQSIELNHKLIDKTKKLLGIKGYYTSLEENKIGNKTIILRYHELYRVEQAFRISKNDLQTRPIYHFKEEPIKLHLLICFVALVISKHIELQSGVSIKKFLTEAKKVTEARIKNKINDTELRLRTQISPNMKKIENSLNLSH